MASRISPSDALILSGTDKKRFTEVSNEFRDRLRVLDICSDALVYSRSWMNQQLFSARTPIPDGFPQILHESDPPFFGKEERLVIDFSTQNIISQYSNPAPPKCLLLLRLEENQSKLSPADRETITKCFHRLYCTLLAIKRTELRSGVLIRAQGETLDSFTNHCLALIDDILLSYEAASAFVPHKRGIPYLSIPATTKGIFQTRGRPTRDRPMRPLIPMNAPVAQALKSCDPLVTEDMDHPYAPIDTDDNVDQIWNCIQLPLTLQRDNLRKLETAANEIAR